MPNASDFNRFASNPVNIDISRSMFNMDHSVKFSANVGEVIPFDCIEILPGDSLEIDTSKVIRLQPMVAPIMDEVICDLYWFFVPHRLVWSHWQEFMGENNESAWSPSVEYNIPTIAPPIVDESNNRYWKVGTIADYMGLPVGQIDYNREYNALPFRSYALICDQWFRSESVMDPVHVHVDDTNRDGSNGSDQVTDIELGGKPFIACKFFDYFTSCLPSPQRGNPVSIPLVDGNTILPLRFMNENDSHYSELPYGYGKNPVAYESKMEFGYRNYSNGAVTGAFTKPTSKQFPMIDTDGVVRGYSTNGEPSSYLGVINNGYVNIPERTFNAVTINDLRTAFAVQKYLEKQARFGGRYQEFIKGFFGIDSPDARLQRSEYLGGSRISLNISQVPNTTDTSANVAPIGSVAGMSVTADVNSDFTKSFTEHGFVIGCCVLRYHHSYQDSIHKMWLRESPYDYYVPVFANLGETPVLKKQLYGYSDDNTAFGYNECWAEYRYLPSRISGELRSVYSTPLDMWHLGDHYRSAPTLSPEWLREDKSNLDRCLAVTSDVSNQAIFDFFVKTKMVRAMPLYSIPGLVDHH